jgi:hypothetical protein
MSLGLRLGLTNSTPPGNGAANLAAPVRRSDLKLQQRCGEIVAQALLSEKGMTVYSAQYHAMVHSPVSEQVTVTAEKPQNGPQDKAAQEEGFFHHLLDVVNPLQHLPLIGTLYRAITGDHMGPVEKIMGDALYGGLWGAVSSVADVAFEGLTGKSVEDTVLGWFHDDGTSNIAAAKVMAPNIAAGLSLPPADLPALPAAQLASSIPDSPDMAAFGTALSAKGVNGEMAQRAMYAYRRSMGLTPSQWAAPQPVLSAIN